MELRSVESLFEDQLKDLYSAENQLLKALQKMAKRAESDSLRSAFERHLEQTRGHVDRLTGIGEELGLKLGGKKCAAMEGIIEEGSEVLEADGEDAVIDAALVAAAQRAEHYEITAYGTARTLARHLGLEQAVEELQRTLEEESATDELLTKICEEELLPSAGGGMEGMQMEGEEEFEGSAEMAGMARGGGRAGGGGRAKGTQRRTAGRSADSSAKGSSSRPKKGKTGGNGGARGRSGSSAKSRAGASSRRR